MLFGICTVFEFTSFPEQSSTATDVDSTDDDVIDDVG